MMSFSIAIIYIIFWSKFISPSLYTYKDVGTEQRPKYQKTISKDISIDYLNDMSFYVKRRLSVLVSNGIIGLALMILTLLLFLNVRIALVTALGVPFAFLTAIMIHPNC